LSSDKSRTHFPILREGTGIPYEGMLFFDDCNWTDHCTAVGRACEGVVTVRTPQGITDEKWEEGIRKYDERYKA
jgi:magnesium-dependent phosphatase 1